MIATATAICRICGSDHLEPLDVDSFLIPATSFAPDIHDYENHICGGCGVVFGSPPIEDERLREHYASEYWRTVHALELGGRHIDLPLDFDAGPLSFQRVHGFFETVTRVAARHPDVVPTPRDLVIDYGAYQGLFLHGVHELWGARCIAYDHNAKGIEFAQHFLGFAESRVATDILRDTFGERAKYVTVLHTLEHLTDPVAFLEHVRTQVLAPDGYLYVEVPNLYGFPLNDPLHLFSYSQDSLRRLFARAGFETIETATSGFPPRPDFLCQNDSEYLIGLARPALPEARMLSGNVDLGEIRRTLRRSWRRHAWGGLRRQGGRAVRETARLAYYFLFAGILEAISPALALGLARRLGFRRNPTVTSSSADRR